MEKSVKEFSPANKEINISPTTLRPFARGLWAKINNPLGQISSAVDHIGTFSQFNGKPTEEMKKSLDRINLFFANLRTSKEVKIIAIARGFDFQFSEEKEDDQKPISSEIILDDDLKKNIMTAVNHNLKNSLMPISVHGELIGLRDKDGIAAKDTESIDFSVREINELLNTLTEAQELKISTDAKGNSTIAPLSKEVSAETPR